MSKKIISLFIGLIFFSLFHIVFADLVIDEIMYNPLGTDTNTEWIELQNTGTSPVDLSLWSVADFDTSWHFHTITPENSPTLNSGAYALIVHTSQSNFADFKAKMPNFNGLLFRASFTLGNDAGRLALSSDKINVLDDTTYTSTTDTTDTGNSLQLINNSWAGAWATPGATNNTIEASTSSGTGSLSSGGIASNNLSNDNSSEQSATTSQTKTKISEAPRIKTQITVKTLAFAGIPVEFSANSTGLAGEKLLYGKYYWNFGDGDSREIQMNNDKFTHTYFYAGDYVVNLEYYMNAYGQVPDASDKITVKVVPTDISISSVGDEKDFFVELSNDTSYDADISNWIISSVDKSFVIPRDTIISSKKKIIISSKITHFTISDKNSLKLMNPGRETIFDYAAVLAPVAPVKDVAQIQPEISSSIDHPAVKLTKTYFQKENKEKPIPIAQIPIENIEASAVQSDVEENSPTNSYLPALFSIIFIGIGAGAVYFVRQKKSTINNGDDFNILDE